MSTTAPFHNSVKDSFLKLQEFVLNCNHQKSNLNLDEETMVSLLHKLDIGKREIKKSQPTTYPGIDVTTKNNLIFLQLISAIMKRQVDLDFLQEFFLHHEKNSINSIFTAKARPEAYKDLWTEHHYQHYFHMTTLLLNAYKDCREALTRTKADLYATCKRVQQNIELLRQNHLKLTHETRQLIIDKNEVLQKIQGYEDEIKTLKQNAKEKPNENKEIEIRTAHIQKLKIILDNIRKEGTKKIKDLKNAEQNEIEDLNSLKVQKQKLDVIDKEMEKNNDVMAELGLNLGTQDNTYSFDTTSILNLFKEKNIGQTASRLDSELNSSSTEFES